MERQKQVCTLEQAKRLKELGVKQESLFCYSHHKDHFNKNMAEQGYRVSIIKGELYGYWTSYDHFSAYTVAELGEMLPEWVYSKKDSLRQTGYSTFFCDAHVRMPENINKSQIFYGVTEAESRAAMLICLLEQNLITPHKK